MPQIALTFLALAGLTAFAPAPFPRRAKAEDLSASLQGNWDVVSYTRSLGGGKAEALGFTTTHVTVRGDRWVMMRGEDDQGSYRIRVDATRRPAWIDFVAVGDGSLVSAGIIRRDGDTLRVLYVEGDADRRPLSFENAPAGCLRAEFKRKR